MARHSGGLCMPWAPASRGWQGRNPEPLERQVMRLLDPGFRRGDDSVSVSADNAESLPQNIFLHFAHRIAWQLGDEVHAFWNLEVRQLSL